MYTPSETGRYLQCCYHHFAKATLRSRKWQSNPKYSTCQLDSHANVAACTIVEMLFTPLLIFLVCKSSIKDTTTTVITLSKAEPYGFYKSAVNL